MAIIGAGALGAAGVGSVVGVSVLNRNGTAPSEQASGDEFSICLKSGVGFFNDLGPRCYSRAELAQLRDQPVIDQTGRKIAVTMTHPSDSSMPPAQYSTCRQYDEARFEDWYAMTTRDMRREAYFTRACGSLDLLLDAGPAETSHFADGSPVAAEIASLGGDRLLRIGPDPAPGAPVIEKINAAEWRVSFDDQRVMLQEIANADFDGDRIEEILVFVVARPEGGTAIVSAVALLEKDRAGGPVVLTPTAKTSRKDPSGAP